jgi:hypothetical protein
MAARQLHRGLPADLWRHTLSQIPSIFGRLVYLASLRNANTGRYEHHGLALIYGEEESDLVLRKSHVEAFWEWINYGLEQQKADLDLYLSALSTDRKTVVDTWLRLAPYRNMLPGTAGTQERQLYLTDLETLLWLLRNEYGLDVPAPGA